MLKGWIDKKCLIVPPCLIIIVMAAIISTLPACPAQGAQYPPVSLRNTELRKITSSSIGQEYRLHIYLPPGYSDTARRFPVVYLTDSDAYFEFFRSAAGSLSYGNLIPEIIIVGIAYEEDTDIYLRKRERDLLPTAVPGHPGSGGAGLFLDFIDDELIPFVESNYRVDAGDRTLVGMSAGATFSAYVLFTRPRLFSRYIIISPYLIYGQESIIESEKAYAADHDSLTARVYTAMGELESDLAILPWNKLTDTVESRRYAGLEIKRETISGLRHMDVFYTAAVEGMKRVFADGSRTLKAVPENFQACEGVYEIASAGKRFMVRVRDGGLFISGSGEYWDRLIPVTDTKFVPQGNNSVRFSFKTGSECVVSKMIIHQMGIETPAAKIE